jgi:hypothetical protein
MCNVKASNKQKYYLNTPKDYRVFIEVNIDLHYGPCSSIRFLHSLPELPILSSTAHTLLQLYYTQPCTQEWLITCTHCAYFMAAETSHCLSEILACQAPRWFIHFTWHCGHLNCSNPSSSVPPIWYESVGLGDWRFGEWDPVDTIRGRPGFSLINENVIQLRADVPLAVINASLCACQDFNVGVS